LFQLRLDGDVVPRGRVLAQARAVIGDLTIVFCGDCIRQATARMVDEA
jgi:hypothetical protein